MKVRNQYYNLYRYLDQLLSLHQCPRIFLMSVFVHSLLHLNVTALPSFCAFCMHYTELASQFAAHSSSCLHTSTLYLRLAETSVLELAANCCIVSQLENCLVWWLLEQSEQSGRGALMLLLHKRRLHPCDMHCHAPYSPSVTLLPPQGSSSLVAPRYGISLSDCTAVVFALG
jgi:hypothetical protein